MSSAVSVFSLVPADLRRTVHDGNVVRHPVSHYLDVARDGGSLREMLGVTGAGLITPLNRPWLDTVPQAVDEWCCRRPDTDLAPGRVRIFVCGECGDLSCAAVTARVDVGPSLTTWSDFRWEDGEGVAVPVSEPPGAIVFATADYLTTLATAADRVAALPYDAAEHAVRPFLWPWQWGWRTPEA